MIEVLLLKRTGDLAQGSDSSNFYSSFLKFIGGKTSGTVCLEFVGSYPQTHL